MDEYTIIQKISRNFYVLQIAKTLLILFMIFSAHTYQLPISLGLGFIALSLQITTLTSAHHNYTASLNDQNKWYIHTIVIDLITTTLIFINSLLIFVGVLKL